MAALEQRDLETARDAFFDSLALTPGDSKTRFNLEWTLLGLAVQPPPSPPEPRAEEESVRSASPADKAAPEPAESHRVHSTPNGAMPTPSEAERARLLDRVIDDPTRGFRSGRDRMKYRRPSGLAW